MEHLNEGQFKPVIVFVFVVLSSATVIAGLGLRVTGDGFNGCRAYRTGIRVIKNSV